MKFSRELMKGTAELIVLKALQEEGESYGYQLIKVIQASSDNIFQFQEGTLYPLLYRLEEKEYVRSIEKAASNGKNRRYYSLTQKGAHALKNKAEEVRGFMKGLSQVLNSY